MAIAPMILAQDPGDRNLSTYSDNLSLEWYGVPTGDCTNVNNSRSGIGVNGKFYITVNNKGVAVYNKDGQIKFLDNNTTWVSINCDDAGNVYFRNDIVGWPGAGGGAGWYMTENGRFCIISSKTDEIIKSNVPMKGGPKSRFDALPHVSGDMVNGFVEIPVVTTGAGYIGLEFFYDALEQAEVVGQFNIDKELKDGGFPAPANATQTLGSCQIYSGIDKMAVLANNYISITSSRMGWGNNISQFVWNNKANGYQFSGKWLNTPNHSGVGGFCMFEYDGKAYIVYPAGMTADDQASGDGFLVMEEELVDTPKNKTATEDPADWSEQLHKAVAYKYATSGIAGSGNQARYFNVEPVAGEDGKFRIYLYNPNKSMQVWILDLSGSAGIDDLVVADKTAKIFGGNGEVIVDGAVKAQVYTVSGQLMAEGSGSIAVPAGVYVVKAGSTAAKVVVK